MPQSFVDLNTSSGPSATLSTPVKSRFDLLAGLLCGCHLSKVPIRIKVHTKVYKRELPMHNLMRFHEEYKDATQQSKVGATAPAAVLQCP